ncbi:spliceosome-associated CWC15 family protein [Sporobolomyces koalae]|uniref:spliceosome-associated CWC15 family protein n=1 Tax=Sporobolomyces koalae TaxID=500713 RepID=UPI003179A59C
MSSAHRPTWAPAQGKEGRQNSKVYSSRDLASHTKLKFRQVGQDNASEVQRRDLKLELLQAERESALRKNKGERGLVVDKGLLLLENQDRERAQAEEQNKRRKLLQEVADLDKDDEDDDDNDNENDDDGEGANAQGTDVKGKGKATNDDDDEDDDDDDSDDDDDEDETAELLRELEKIKKERAEEKERQERERAASEQTSREEEIALGNPLLNLQAALGASPSTMSTVSRSDSSSSFAIKRRWDDDVIFKNQARGVSETPKKEFVNDLLRTEFHKKFLSKFVA